MYDNCGLCMCLIHFFVAFDSTLGVSCANKELLLLLLHNIQILITPLVSSNSSYIGILDYYTYPLRTQ